MNNAVLVLILVWLLTPGVVQAQLTAPTQTKDVQGQILTSTSLPPIRIKFEDNFKHIGNQKFILYQKAQAEQFFFVDADSERRVKRMYWLQFAAYLPNVDATYDRPVTKSITIDGQSYLVNAVNVPLDLPKEITISPESDSAHAMSFLLSKGYRFSEHLAVQRLIRLVDEDRRNEIMLVYIEDAEIFPVPDKTNKNFWARGLKGFTVLKE